MSKRQAFYVDETMNPDGKGFIPALVTEGEPGYTPMGDYRSNGVDGPLAYRWGSTIEEARKVTASANAQRGIDADAALTIVASSMFAGRS